MTRRKKYIYLVFRRSSSFIFNTETLFRPRWVQSKTPHFVQHRFLNIYFNSFSLLCLSNFLFKIVYSGVQKMYFFVLSLNELTENICRILLDFYNSFFVTKPLLSLTYLEYKIFYISQKLCYLLILANLILAY